MRQLTCKNLNIGYHDGLVAENINFHIDEGDYMCILGENGSGKTTLMKTIQSLAPSLETRINTGRISSFGAKFVYLFYRISVYIVLIVCLKFLYKKQNSRYFSTGCLQIFIFIFLIH